MSTAAHAPPLHDPHTEASAGNAGAARALASAIAVHGVPVFLSPGSRNTPLAVAFDDLARARANVAVHVMLDERVAAFAALGASRASQGPAVLLCTSGTAAGHYVPAVMEAHASRVPLIVITADRPPELHHCGAPQTVVQHALFSSYVRWQVTLATPRSEQTDRDIRWLSAMGSRARLFALGSPPGPVHLNAPFRKPLLDTARMAQAPVPKPMTLLRGRSQLDDVAVGELATRLAATRRGVVHCGPDSPATIDTRALAAAVGDLAAQLDWPVLADGVSGVRFAGRAVHHAEALARAGVVPKADTVLRIGGAPTNQALNQWISDIPDGVLLDPDGAYHDPQATCSTLVVADTVALLNALRQATTPRSTPSGWAQRWQELDKVAAGALQSSPNCAGIEAAAAIADAVAVGARVHVASSMAVRDFDVVARRDTPIDVTSNRGVNGIDGTIATALGIALATTKPTTVLLGDLAFAHDVGGLMAACQAAVCLTLVVVNNAGGGIFEMLPVAQQLERERFERLFRAPQSWDLGRVATAAGAKHVSASASDIRTAIRSAQTHPGVTVIEIREDRADEAARRNGMWHHVGDTLRRFASETAS